MLIDPNSPCPCRSGKTAELCCFPVEAPIASSGARLASASVHASIVDQNQRSIIPPGLNVSVTFNQPYQQDDEIERRMSTFVDNILPLSGLSSNEADQWFNVRATAIEQLSDSIYAVRYHQRQFLYRLSRVYAEQLFSFEPPRGNTSIVINDRPLKAELEAFLFRVTASMDSLAKSICVANNIKPMKFGELAANINKMAKPMGIFNDLKKTIKHVEKWIVPLKKFRDAIAHDGDCKGFIGVSHKGILVNDAQIGGVSAGNYVIDTWKLLLAAVDDVIQGQKAAAES